MIPRIIKKFMKRFSWDAVHWDGIELTGYLQRERYNEYAGFLEPFGSSEYRMDSEGRYLFDKVQNYLIKRKHKIAPFKIWRNVNMHNLDYYGEQI